MGPSANDLILQAFDALKAKPGFVERPDQRQLALLLSDCMSDGSRGAFEAPTGLGKSLAALIPAMAHAAVGGKRTVIATYTNVLAEQYWHSDLPLAQSLLPDVEVAAAFLIGRQRYVCAHELRTRYPDILRQFRPFAELGIETEFRKSAPKPGREMANLWKQVSVPIVCPARRCPDYHDCWFYKARNKAEKASIVITNHSVVMMDALLSKYSNNELSLLGDYQFLVIDEAHDFAQAAANSLEFELSDTKFSMLTGLVERMEDVLVMAALQAGEGGELEVACSGFVAALESAARDLRRFQGHPGIFSVTPDEVLAHPAVKAASAASIRPDAEELAGRVAQVSRDFLKVVEKLAAKWQHYPDVDAEGLKDAKDILSGYQMVFRELAEGCDNLFNPMGVAVSYASDSDTTALLRSDVIDLSGPLKELVWSRKPYACLSATLALDGHFGFFNSVTGCEPDFAEVLPSPFDFSTQAALYLPPDGAMIDPTLARKMGAEEEYFDRVAAQVSEIITTLQGRTLALFHSRREMEAVHERLALPDDLPIYVQRRSGAATHGDRFRKEVRSSLLALRSFWTGFDAPGETLSCVVLVRVPFEVPVDPASIARNAWLASKGEDAFGTYSLPMAKMLVRQGAGRLIRRAEDKGIIAFLDARLTTKRYGEAILANLPSGMRTFRDIGDAVGWVGL